MALDPKKWTVKTQEAFATALDLARSNANPELTPDHMLSVIAGQDGTIVPALLGKLGQAPLMVKNKADEAVAKLPKRPWRRRTTPVPPTQRRRRPRPADPEGPQGRLPLRRAPTAGDERPPRREQ